MLLLYCVGISIVRFTIEIVAIVAITLLAGLVTLGINPSLFKTHHTLLAMCLVHQLNSHFSSGWYRLPLLALAGGYLLEHLD